MRPGGALHQGGARVRQLLVSLIIEESREEVQMIKSVMSPLIIYWDRLRAQRGWCMRQACSSSSGL